MQPAEKKLEKTLDLKPQMSGKRKEYKRGNGPATLYMGSAHETEKIVR